MHSASYLSSDTCSYLCTPSSGQYIQLCSQVVNQVEEKLKQSKNKKHTSGLSACPEPAHCGAWAYTRKKAGKGGWRCTLTMCVRKTEPLLLLTEMTPRYLSVLIVLTMGVVLKPTLFFLSWLILSPIGS